MLNDAGFSVERSRCAINKLMNFLGEAGQTTIKYVKAQLIMLLINLLLIASGMAVVGMRFWSLPLAVGIALLDLLPIIGSGAVFVPWIIVCVVRGDTRAALCLGVTYLLMVLVRLILEPIIVGKKVGLSPLITFASAVVGVAVFGGTGVFIGPVVAAIANTLCRMSEKSSERNKFKYGIDTQER